MRQQVTRPGAPDADPGLLQLEDRLGLRHHGQQQQAEEYESFPAHQFAKIESFRVSLWQMKYLTLTSTDPHYNMAFDQYMLERPELPQPVFYLWQNRPSVIIGENQSAYSEVNLPYLEEKGIALARRVTGGGAVYHDLGNLNYTIVGRSRDLEADYPGYVHLVADALRSLGLSVELSGRNDILLDGRKCSGYAKRIWKDRLMVHGTLMFQVDLEELTKALSVPGSKFTTAGVASVRSRVVNLADYLPQGTSLHAFRADLQRILAQNDSKIVLLDTSKAEIARLANEKFRTDEWIFGHSPRTDFVRIRKFACGTVRADFSVKSGRIVNLRFSGDFLGNVPTLYLEEKLNGSPFSKAAIAEHLPDGVSDYFDQMDLPTFLSFLLRG